MNELVQQSQKGDVAVVTINNPPVNALSPGVPEGIGLAIEAAAADPQTKAVVIIGGGRTFIAGADIKEFGKMTSGEKPRGVGLLPLLLAIEDCPKPVVVAIHGTAFGGGLEVAMACHYRVAVPTAQVGQPEVKLGIIPGAAGTQRLPRLVGIARAAELCAIGNPIRAAEAAELGLVDKIIEGDLLDGAIAFAREIVAQGQPPRKTREQQDRLAMDDTTSQQLDQLRAQVRKRSRGATAPLKAIDAVEAAGSLSFDDGCRKEAEIFLECLHSEQSKSLIHVFFGERTVAKIPDVPKDTPKADIQRAAVVGGGTMGGGIAMVYANAGIPVLLKEVDQQRLDRAVEIIRANYAATVKKGRMTQDQLQQRMELIQPTLTYDEFGDIDIVIEAVFEGMELKQAIFRELDEVVRDGAVLASNTSTLDIDAIASVTKRPEQVIGHHFFSPANVMRLLEIVRGKQTSKPVVATSMALARRLGKVGVLVGNCRGFVGNRMYGPYQRESQFLLDEGARVEEVDAVLTGFGWAMGPLAVGDLAGLDVGWRIRKEYKHLEPEGMRALMVADKLCEMGRYGQKTGRGWYRYEEGSRVPIPDPDVEKMIADCAAESGIKRRKISPEEIIERTVYALVNEGARILDEGMALRALDIDIIYIYGYGFPPHRGGPMHYADAVGLKNVYQRIAECHEQLGFWWEPAPLLKRLADEGKSFADFDREKAVG